MMKNMSAEEKEAMKEKRGARKLKSEDFVETPINDCHAISTENACNAPYTKLGCSWCKSAAVKSACRTLEEAEALPSAVFECSNLDEEAEYYDDLEDDEYDQLDDIDGADGEDYPEFEDEEEDKEEESKTDFAYGHHMRGQKGEQKWEKKWEKYQKSEKHSWNKKSHHGYKEKDMRPKLFGKCPFPYIIVVALIGHLYFIRKYADALDTFISSGGKIEFTGCKWMKKCEEKKAIVPVVVEQSNNYDVVDMNSTVSSMEDYPQVIAPQP